MALAVRLNGLTQQEALTAATVNAAAALGRPEAGRLEVGLPADLLVLESSDWRDLLYALGKNMVKEVWISGRRQNV
jgi:imidazolonepropionase